MKLSAFALIAALTSAFLPTQASASSRYRVWQPRISGGIDTNYNDNVLGLSEPRIQLFESGAAPQQFRIHSVDDTVLRSWLQGGIASHDNELGANLVVNTYLENSLKSSEQLSLYAQHRLDGGDALRATYTWLRKGYAGELESPKTPGLIESKFYDVHRFDSRFQHRLSERWRLTPRLAAQLLLYDEGTSDPRTLAGAELGLATTFQPRPWLDLALDLEFEQMSALAARSDFDRSYRRYAVELGPRFRMLGGHLVTSLLYRFAYRTYTTDNASALDPLHRDRSDPSHRIQARIEHSWRRVSVHLAYTRDDYRADAPGAPALTDEEMSFARNLVSAGVGLRY